MQVELITIGDELLIGQVVNTNAALMARKLNEAGFAVSRMLTVPDENETIIAALGESASRVGLVISTGGLGPTGDDTTKAAYCRFTEDVLVENRNVRAHVEHLFSRYITTPISDRNIQQALVPKKARVLHNPHGTAPGLWMEHEGVVFVALPGVPYEMEYLLLETVIPLLRERFETEVLLHRTLITYGLGESAIADRIVSIEEQLPTHIKLAYLPNAGRVRLRLSGRSGDAQLLSEELEAWVQALSTELSDIVTGEEGQGELPQVIGEQLQHLGWSLATAESLTGGRIASALVAEGGASSFFKGGVVTYATASKMKVLDIPAELVNRHTVVSEEVVLAMAAQAATLFGADCALATTGVAGPEPGESGQPVGTVWIGLQTPLGSQAYPFLFGSHRERITQKSVNKALELLFQELRKKTV